MITLPANRTPGRPEFPRWRRRFPLSYNKTQIGVATVVLLVALRLCLGCHFLYEGVWKIKNPDKFSSVPLLKEAKGPAAGLFQGMIPDLEGRERLKVERVVVHEGLLAAWRNARNVAVKRYGDITRNSHKDELAGRKDFNGNELLAMAEEVEPMRIAIDQVLWKAEDRLEAFLADNHKAILDFLETRSEEESGDKKKALDEKAAAWLTSIAKLQDEYAAALEELAGEDEDARRAILDPVRKIPPIFTEGAKVEDQLDGTRLHDAKNHVILKIDRRILADKFYKPWNKLKQKVINKYALSDQQKVDAELIFRQYKESVRTLLEDNRPDIEVYFAALARFDKMQAVGNRGVAHQQERTHKSRKDLLGEVDVWLTGLEKTQQGYYDALADLLTEKQAAIGELPVPWTRMDYIDSIMIFSLTAIGLCLVLGLFTRPAALGGAAFLFSVVLIQPAWPTIYPPAPPVVGHALLINKDFIEMVVLVMLATTAVGRWGGLDYFVEGLLVRLWESRGSKTVVSNKKGGEVA